MAKINHNNFVDTVNDMLGQARNKEVMHLVAGGNEWTGKSMQIGGKDLVNFGTCGYLGLETNSKLKREAQRFVEEYGTQFSISRAFVASEHNLKLESLLSQIFGGHKTVVFSSTTLAHVSVVPILMGVNDFIIIDQQAHLSMQTATQLMATKGVPIQLIRHNNLEMLERKLIANRNKFEKVWYVIDGVYSMYGDLAPFNELIELSEKYPELHFYVDDAHGVSWFGENGHGCAYDLFAKTGKTILVSTMAKGFGSIGGVVVFPDAETYEKVNVYGGPLSFSHPLAPAVVGASMASAEIHLSEEIETFQFNLKERMQLCNELLSETEIPILSNPETPIYFLGTGQPNVGFNLNKRILDEGFYINLGIFPAVSIKNTGLRFTITNHVSLDDVRNFVDAIKFHYPKALSEEGVTMNKVRRAFKLAEIDEGKKNSDSDSKNLVAGIELIKSYSIEDFKEEEWDYYMKDKAGCSWGTLKMIEEAYKGNALKEENAEFVYFMVRDKNSGEVICCTVFSLLTIKDDMFEIEGKSITIEGIRKDDPYYLTSKSYFMGTMLTEGDHLYIDKNLDWQEAINTILESLAIEQERTGANNILLRDFDSNQGDMADFLYDKGFAKINVPNSNEVTLPTDFSQESFENILSKNSKKNFKRFVKRYKEDYEAEVCNSLDHQDLITFQTMHEAIRLESLSVNIFKYPDKVFEKINANPSWEFIKLKEKETGEILAIGCAFKTGECYTPVLLGLGKTRVGLGKVYHQMLYRAVRRAVALGCTKVRLGLSADQAKKDVGARQISKVAFIQSRDNYNFEVIENIISRDVRKGRV